MSWWVRFVKKKFDSRQGSGMGGVLIPVGKSSFLLGNLKIQGFCDVVFEYYGIQGLRDKRFMHLRIWEFVNLGFKEFGCL